MISKTNNAKVIHYRDGVKYSGNIVVPETIEYDGIIYNVTIIADQAFSYSSGLTSVTIPNSVTNIGDGAFKGCSSLTQITIGNSVERMGMHAFGKCPEIKDVYCYTENVPSTNDNDAFVDSYIDYATLHVLDASVNLYKSAEPWKNFKEIIALTDSDPKPSGIKMINNTTYGVNKFYNLSGLEIEDPQKGIYITNGKKIVMKK